MLVAAGNVYRTLDWPEGADPLTLAVGSNAAAAVMLLAIGLAGEGVTAFTSLGLSPGVVLVQVLSSAGMFALFFRLQRVGGPVFLSQIGYVGAAVGLVSGSLVLGERYPATTWGGALIVAVGIALMTRSQAAAERGR
jgi:drug/metabolite transporter (DMT)-like permease